MNCKCENCDRNHSGEYGSGRFCSSKCARSYSTKEKRSKINEKIRQKLKESGHGLVQKTCPSCEKIFFVAWNKRKQKSCSLSCAAILSNKNPKTKKKQSIARINAIKSGKQNSCGIKCEYKFQGYTIQCDSKLEYACLDYFENIMGANQMRRCDETITYLDNGITRRYLPDFIINVEETEYIVECKSFASKDLNTKWRKYNELAEIKKIELEKYAKKTNRKSFWFTKNIHSSYYSKLKL